MAEVDFLTLFKLCAKTLCTQKVMTHLVPSSLYVVFTGNPSLPGVRVGFFLILIFATSIKYQNKEKPLYGHFGASMLNLKWEKINSKLERVKIV